MILFINTIQNNIIEIGFKDQNKIIARKQYASDRTQAEKLLPEISKFLKANRLKLSDFKAIEAANRGGSFTSLRIGVVTANALAFALGIPASGEAGRTKTVRGQRRIFNIVAPLYSSQAKITKKRSGF